MDIYTVYCTTEQTKKALKLGAPIATHWSIMTNDWIYDNPLTEQMIGWLEENNIENIIVCKKDGGDYGYTVYHTSHRKPLQRFWFSNRKEATLAAIDAALEYLTKNKKII